MRFLVDTNVLLRSVQRSHPSSRAARQALAALYRGDHHAFLATQNLAEFWNVCTRPLPANGLGFSIRQTDRYVHQLERFFTVLPDSLDAFRRWRELVVNHEVKGVKVHDARLVALMQTNAITGILTFNLADFERFSGLRAIHPETITSAV